MDGPLRDDALSADPVAMRGSILAIVDPSVEWRPVAEAAARLSRALETGWTALYVETPEPGSAGEAADALTAAAALGGAAVSVPAASEPDGVVAFVERSAVSHILIANGRGPRKFGRDGALLRDLLARKLDAALVVIPTETRGAAAVAAREVRRTSNGFGQYMLAAAAVVATIPLVLLLRTLIGSQALALLFLLPVVGTAARFGFLPSLLATLLSALSYDFFILRPVNSIDPGAPQNLLLLAVLAALAGYTSLLTGRLRARIALSDRSAQENAALAAFGLDLARAADWQSTARVVCKAVAEMLGVRTAIFREIDGDLALVGANPAPPTFSPVDQAALDLAWREGEETGSGTVRVGAADWQFHPLATSLGRLAVLALASDDGRDPIRPDRKVLLSTMIGQAALAHERLRLEDLQALGAGRPRRGRAS